MISPAEIKIKAEKKYISFLKSITEGQVFSKLVIPGDKSYIKNSLPDFEKEILLILSQSKERRGFGYTLEFQKVKTKHLGTQDIPSIIYFDSENDFLKYLGKEKEVAFFRSNYQMIISTFPELKIWVTQNPTKVIQKQSEWEGILKVCAYFKNSPKPNLYTRELPIKVHTKFIESNQSTIKELLDLIISENININEKQFEKRFNLKYSEPLVRFKVLDKEISDTFFSGLDDLSIPVSQFENLKLPVSKVLIVENKTTLYTTLALPSMKSTIAVFGGGSNVHNLKNVAWFTDVEIIYWGDIDVQGFEILSQFRAFHPATKSVLMDQDTFDKYFENDAGTITKLNAPLCLNEIEYQLYEILKVNNWRLEQEKIPFEYTCIFF